MRLERLVHVVQRLQVDGIVEVLHLQQRLQVLHTLFRQRRRAVLLVDGVMFLFFEPRDDAVDAVVLVGGLLRRPGDNQRRARFVNQNRVHLIHDGEVVRALHAVALLELHVVAQVVEPELVVGAVGDVGAVGGFALFVGLLVHNHAHFQPQGLVHRPHPFGVALGQVVVDGHDVDAAAQQRVQAGRQRRHQRLAFAGLHLRDLAFVQHHPAHQLHVEVPHRHCPPAHLPHQRKHRRQHLLQRRFFRLAPLLLGGLFLNLPRSRIARCLLDCPALLFDYVFQTRLHLLAELSEALRQLGVRQPLHLGFEPVDSLHLRLHALSLALVLRPENFRQ